MAVVEGLPLTYFAGTAEDFTFQVLKVADGTPRDISGATTIIEFAVAAPSTGQPGNVAFTLTTADPTQISKTEPLLGIFVVQIRNQFRGDAVTDPLRYQVQITFNAGGPLEEKRLLQEGDFIIRPTFFA